MVFAQTWQRSFYIDDTDPTKDGCKRGINHALQCRKYKTSNHLSIRSMELAGKQTTGITIVLEDVF